MKGRRHRFGTDIGGLDPASLQRAATGRGTDTRFWSSHGTICTIGDDGELDFKDPAAVLIGPEGVECDVELEPIGIHCTAVYAGISAGDVTIFPPIRPGNRVLVACPDGDLTTPVITAILNSRSLRLPVDSGGTPLFDNKRLLVHSKAGIPMTVLSESSDITVTCKATTVTIKDGQIQLASTDATAANGALVLGGAREVAESAAWQGLLAAFAELQAACQGPLSQFAPGCGHAVTTLANFINAAGTAKPSPWWLSKISSTG